MMATAGSLNILSDGIRDAGTRRRDPGRNAARVIHLG